ncbi:hypothetical protein K9857_14140 [Pseudomonas sp. REP124]|uniref:hypothetical protein n=1 Tax=Pseudomonas sp. REP124 TaxID=2875731 RepID=UPI001CCF23AE|nr:hypothetical protein [Pseudomonas sp. REP124]MBZ9782680.1 hypothetical protein [Pseudomonas sp. REP124]
MLAMDVNEDAGCLVPRGVLETIASKLGSYRGIGSRIDVVVNVAGAGHMSGN